MNIFFCTRHGESTFYALYYAQKRLFKLEFFSKEAFCLPEDEYPKNKHKTFLLNKRYFYLNQKVKMKLY